MNNEFKKIAKQLGIAIPACLLSIGVANAETVKENEVSNDNNAAVSEISKSNLVNNEVVKFMTTDFTNGMNKVSPDHTNVHTDQQPNHTNQHTNGEHTNYHVNQDAYNKGNQCIPHSDSHSNYGERVNIHTNNGGNEYHTDIHDNFSANKQCPPK